LPELHRPRPARDRYNSRPRRSGAARQTTPRPAPASELDRALAAALRVPAPAETTFAALNVPQPVVSALAHRDIRVPFAIQARALPDALAGRDVLGRAHTGSGKTLAFGLALLSRLPAEGRRPGRAPRGLVLVPTRELAVQVADVLAPLGQTLGLKLATVYGGVSISRQIDQLRRGVDIVVATPGRLIDLLDRGACALDMIQITVLDEADHMADLGFLPAVTRILDATPAGGQRMLFSATLDRGVARLVSQYLTDPVVHAIAPPAETVTAIDHRVFVLPAADKVAVAAEIAARPARTLFFVRTKHGADRLVRQLRQAGVEAAAIHGNINQNRRQRALAAFAEGDPRVLVATDVAARGIHIDNVDLVVHFDPPNDHKDYLHRSGRTARAGAHGTVIALAQPEQVRDIGRMHDAAGVRPTTARVQAGDQEIRDIAIAGPALLVVPTAGSVSPAAPAAGRSGRPSDGPARSSGRGRGGPVVDRRGSSRHTTTGRPRPSRSATG
jgi:superfamily II DNA/RNA helicase